jgi:hypothetical protein
MTDTTKQSSDHVRQLVDAAPSLSKEQQDRLSELLKNRSSSAVSRSRKFS